MRSITLGLFVLIAIASLLRGNTPGNPELIFTNVSGRYMMRIVVDYLAEEERIYRGEFVPGARLRIPRTLPIAIQFSHGEFLQIDYAGGTIPHSIKGMGTLVVDFSENGVVARAATASEHLILARDLVPSKSAHTPADQTPAPQIHSIGRNKTVDPDLDLSFLNPLIKELEQIDLNPLIDIVTDYHVNATKRLMAMAQEKEFVDMMATYKRQLYESLVASGFSETEALELVIKDNTLALLINYSRGAAGMLQK